jgi:hypothetical protein
MKKLCVRHARYPEERRNSRRRTSVGGKQSGQLLKVDTEVPKRRQGGDVQHRALNLNVNANSPEGFFICTAHSAAWQWRLLHGAFPSRAQVLHMPFLRLQAEWQLEK